MKQGRIGLVLVHGIGEQRRLEHLDGQLRSLLKGLERLKAQHLVCGFSVDIHPALSSGYLATQEQWQSGSAPSVTVVVQHQLHGEVRETRIYVHEVWWADVNEPYSVIKQIRFWLWGLSVWAHPGKLRSTNPGAAHVRSPRVPDGDRRRSRAELFFAACIFVLIGFPAGLLASLGTRLFNLRMPDVLHAVTNYVSGVKIYNQRGRYGGGFTRQDFLDAMEEPPRVSVRRRVIRVIADVACAGYDRWYIMAHSMGSVVAFNGLMETASAWPGYLDEGRWQRLVSLGLAGPATAAVTVPEPTLPKRPVWVPRGSIAYRRRIFDRLSGIVTYGSPLQKFATIWPGRVPISREPAFGDGVTWINLLDPIDPVSGVLRSFTAPSACCPQPVNMGYNAGSFLLFNHLTYFTARPGHTDASMAVLHWFLADCCGAFPNGFGLNGPRGDCPVGHHQSWGSRGVVGNQTGEWFDPEDQGIGRTISINRNWRRNASLAYLIIVITWLDAGFLPSLLQWIKEFFSAWLLQGFREDVYISFFWRILIALATPVLICLLAGFLGWRIYQRDQDDPGKPDNPGGTKQTHPKRQDEVDSGEPDLSKDWPVRPPYDSVDEAKRERFEDPPGCPEAERADGARG